MEQFSTVYAEILDQIDRVDPVAYGRTRNYLDGAVTRLSPYISRGVISTKQVFKSVRERGFDLKRIEKFIQELAWRDYWQQVWMAKGEKINDDLRREQPGVLNWSMPRAIVEANTGIEAIDDSLARFYESGYLHNHVRMYIASLACNVGKSHWRVPARWMYYHLLDGDWASNALSWQWVSGTNSGKQYYANQDNINKYCHTRQKGTFLDVDYGEFEEMEIPETLRDTVEPDFETPLPEKKRITVDSGRPTLIYNYYNLDPKWHEGEACNRILLIEPSVFKAYPVSGRSVEFMIKLAANIEGVQCYVGEFHDLVEAYDLGQVIYKEHPLNRYLGDEEPREWMFGVTGYYRSFFTFWKHCRKSLFD